jgi:hypothetical protein
MKAFQYLCQKNRTGLMEPAKKNGSAKNVTQEINAFPNPFIRIRPALGPAMTGFLFLLLAFAPPSQFHREYNIKAQYLYNFTQFVDWPPAAFPSPGSPFVIGIIGEDPFRSAIDHVVAGEKAKGHPIIVQRYASVNDIKNCNILFINRSDSAEVNEILSSLPAKNILTVSDLPNFATMGGIIRFYKEKSKVRLEINLPASKIADLNISSKLLQVAKIVR